MTMALLALLLTPTAHAQGNAPYFLRGSTVPQATGALNANYLDQTQRNRNTLVKTVADVDCSQSGGALTGATEKGGFIYGGACTAIPAAGVAATTKTVEFVLIASMNFTSVSVATFTLLSNGSTTVIVSSTLYKVDCWLRAVAGSSFPMLIFTDGTNMDFAQHYVMGGGQGASAPSTSFGTSDGNVATYFGWHMKADTTSQAAGNGLMADIRFQSDTATTTLRGYLDGTGDDSGTQYGLQVRASMAYKRNGANINGLAFCGSSAALNAACTANKTYSGVCYLYQGPTHP